MLTFRVLLLSSTESIQLAAAYGLEAGSQLLEFTGQNDRLRAASST